MIRRSSGIVGAAAGLGALALVTVLYSKWLHVANSATVSTTFLMVVLVVAATSRLWAALATSGCAVLAFNFFFLPPVGTLTIADPQNWVALIAFLAVSFVASNLSARTRARTEEALGRRDELARLFDLSRDVLLMTESREALSVLARAIGRRFDLDLVAIALPVGSDWEIVETSASPIAWDKAQFAAAMASAQVSLEFDAYERTYSGHRTMTVDAHTVRLVPLRVGTKPVGLLAAAGRPVEPGTLDALGGVVAMAIERAQFLDERKAADLTRQSELLKSALLASLAHDLRTPLTAIRVAANNTKDATFNDAERAEQSDVILAEVERLTRLFQNVLDMARIDAGAVATDARWVHPAEVVAAARDQVEHTVRQHRLELEIGPDEPVQLDPRLTATAIAHLLENAAQYAPAGTTIRVASHLSTDGLVIAVRDQGPGIPVADLPHIFERFYRGAGAHVRASGTGMGLAITRGLLAIEGGRVWAENAADGGAIFTILVPVAVRPGVSPEPVPA